MTNLLISLLFFNMIFLSPVFGFLDEKDEDDYFASESFYSSIPPFEEELLEVSFLTEGTSIDSSPDTSRDDDGAEENSETTFSLNPTLKKEFLFELAAEHHTQENRFSGIISEVYTLPQNIKTLKDNLGELSKKRSFEAVKKLLNPKNSSAVNSLFEDKKSKGTLQFLRLKFSAMMIQIIEGFSKGKTLQRYNELKRKGQLLLVDKLFVSEFLLKFLKDQRDIAYETAFFLNHKLNLLGQKHQKKIKKNPLYLENILNLSLHLLELNRLISQINFTPPSYLSLSQVMSPDFWGTEGASYDLILRNCLNSNPLDQATVAQLYDHYTEEEFTKSKDIFNYLEIADAEFSASLNMAQHLIKTYNKLKSDKDGSSMATFEEKIPFMPTSRPLSRTSITLFSLYSSSSPSPHVSFFQKRNVSSAILY